MKKMYIGRTISPSQSILAGCMKMLTLCLLLAGYTIRVNAQHPAFEWAVKMGSTDFDQSLDIKADRSGNTYTTGFYNGASATFGASTITSAGSSDGFLAKCDPAGNFLWAKNLGGSSNDQGTKVTVDGKGNVYVTGGFSSSDFAPTGSTQTFAAASWNNVFVVKYDPAGNFRWAKSLGGSEGDYCNGIAVDGNGNVYLTGSYNSPDFSTGSASNILPPAVNGDVYLVKLDSNGNYSWAKSIGGTDNDESQGITLDSRNNIYITGFFNGSANFNPSGTAVLAAAGVSDVYIAKYDSAGNYIWARRMGSVDDDYGYGVAADKNSNVYVIAAFTSVASFDGTSATLSSAGGRDVLLAKYDSAGNYIWSKGIGNTGWDEGFGVAVDGGNNVYATGAFQETVAFASGGGAPLTSAGGGDVFLAKYDPNGNYIWAKNMGGSSFEQGKGVTVDGSGHVYATGYFLSDPADFNIGGANGILNPEGADGFIVKFGCADTTSGYLRVKACGESYSINGFVYTTSGTFVHVIPNTAGCDSTITLELSLHRIDPQITVNGYELGVNGTYVTYQWIRGGTDIPGETNPTYTVTANDDYSVRVTDTNDCEATSNIYQVTNVSVGDLGSLAKQIRIHPNPVNDIVYINSPVRVNLHLYSIDGRKVMEGTDARSMDVHGLAQGTYLLYITDKDERLIKTEKLLKQ